MKKKKEKFLREMKRWLIFILLGGFFVLFNPHRDSWKFPMGVTAEWAERGRFLGWMIMTGGYPLSLIIRLLIYLLKRLPLKK
ncbi:MAG: hypothetical protein JEY91_01820 [Spirochaetaceae bacterium]|nr:hypothetical protein [Spirochaetaceae bacterium]